MVESPCYLVSVCQYEEAVKNLRWLYDSSQEDDLGEMHDSIVKYTDERKSKESNKLKIILYPDNFKLIVTMIVIQCAATMNCRTIVMLYGSVMMKMYSQTIDERTFVNIYSASLLLSTIIGLPIMTRFSRKSLLTFGFLTTAVIQLLCAYSYHVEDCNENALEFLALVIVALLIIHGFISTSTFTPAMAVLKGEVFPYSVKEVCGAIMSLTNDCSAFMTAKFYFILASTIGLPSLFVIYTFFTGAGLISVYCNINDTKGKTLDQIRSDYMCEANGEQLYHLRNNYKIVKTQVET